MKNSPIVFPFFEYDYLAAAIHTKTEYEIGKIETHEFPDKETVIRINTPVKDSQLIFISGLNNPNPKILPLILAAETARDLGATQIGLVAPYLAYMRQDTQFRAEEGISAEYFSKIISHYFDWMITIDPHLHRISSLSQIYDIPTRVLHATGPIASWIKNNVTRPILIGPDSESAQWVSEIAKIIDAPFLILQKQRLGDKSVRISIPDIDQYQDYTPVLVDDIISSAETMIAAVHHLTSLKINTPVCIGVHAIFAGDAYKHLLNSHPARVVTCNTIPHVTNDIDISPLIVQALLS